MKIVSLLLAAFAGIVITPLCRADDGHFLAYDDYALPSDKWDLPFSIKINLASQTILAFDSGSKIKICQPAEEFACFTGTEFYFAVIKAPLTVGKKWQLDSVHYEVVGQFDYMILGLHEPVFRISSKRKGTREWEYLYSCDRGLIALDSYGSNGKVEHFVLRQSKGFAAGVSCEPH